jgi:hypothetical protein
MAARIAQIKNRNDDVLVERELNWQAKAKGNNQAAMAFKESTISQNSFRAFAFMKGKSPSVHVVHSIGQFLDSRVSPLTSRENSSGSSVTGATDDTQCQSSSHKIMRGHGRT